MLSKKYLKFDRERKFRDCIELQFFTIKRVDMTSRWTPYTTGSQKIIAPAQEVCLQPATHQYNGEIWFWTRTVTVILLMVLTYIRKMNENLNNKCILCIIMQFWQKYEQIMSRCINNNLLYIPLINFFLHLNERALYWAINIRISRK